MLAAIARAMSLTVSRSKSNRLPSRSARLRRASFSLASRSISRSSFCVLVSAANGADASRVLLAASKARFIVVGRLNAGAHVLRQRLAPALDGVAIVCRPRSVVVSRLVQFARPAVLVEPLAERLVQEPERRA